MNFWGQIIVALIVPVLGGILKLILDVNSLKTNHIPHIYGRLGLIEQKLGIETPDNEKGVIE